MTILDDPQKPKRSNYLRISGLLLAIPGLLLAGPLVGYFGGNWLDGKFQTAPWLMISGVVLGFAAAGREVWRLVKRAEAIAAETDADALTDRKKDDPGEHPDESKPNGT